MTQRRLSLVRANVAWCRCSDGRVSHLSMTLPRNAMAVAFKRHERVNAFNLVKTAEVTTETKVARFYGPQCMSVFIRVSMHQRMQQQ